MVSSPDSGDEIGASYRPVRKRTRTGCIQCRSRRRKCDGARPRCRGCEVRGQVCRWGLKASFHPSRAISLSRCEAASLREVEEGRGRSSSRHQQFVDETNIIIDGYSTPDHPSCGPHLPAQDESSPSHVSRPPSQPISGELSIADLFTQRNLPASDIPASPSGNHDLPPLIQSQQFHSVSGPTATDTQTHLYPFLLGQARSKDATPQPVPQFPVTDGEKFQLISAFIRETGTWCETTDSQMHFTVKSIHEMMKSSSFVAAALSLASRQLDYVLMRQRPVTLELYQFTIQLLLGQDPVRADTSILATCTLLCVYEMMASRVEEWRRHLKGCAGFLRAQRWNGSSEGIVKASFWAFARIDVWAAFNSGKATLIPTESWKGNEGSWIKSLHLHPLERNAEVVPAATIRGLSASKRFPPTKVFPEALYIRSAPNCGNTFYHSGCMLLLQTGLVTQGPEHLYASFKEETGNIIWHARELVGISISNPSHANWVNQLQPLFIAGTVFGSSVASPSVRDTLSVSPGDAPSAAENHDFDEFCSEKILLLKHLARIERETGWKTSDRAAELRMLWGFV
ncbi:uncharacterized protein N7446_009353 [Penicillium canescens]|uniref:uncharacterized protein n=1 Tax=Penicillium canescens TaxID=5083 RepID=UPI0026DF0AC6|nr:uncharacterized protein N7446_009353 [Penicillium canescens]KAJ6053341.1 hypothetical protein N7446_009353 [Penicillium canescens]